MASSLTTPDGSVLSVDLNDSDKCRNDDRAVAIPVHVLQTLLARYYMGGGEPSDFDERLYDCGYYDRPIKLENKA